MTPRKKEGQDSGASTPVKASSIAKKSGATPVKASKSLTPLKNAGVTKSNSNASSKSISLLKSALRAPAGPSASGPEDDAATKSPRSRAAAEADTSNNISDLTATDKAVILNPSPLKHSSGVAISEGSTPSKAKTRRAVSKAIEAAIAEDAIEDDGEDQQQGVSIANGNHVEQDAEMTDAAGDAAAEAAPEQPAQPSTPSKKAAEAAQQANGEIKTDEKKKVETAGEPSAAAAATATPVAKPNPRRKSLLTRIMEAIGLL